MKALRHFFLPGLLFLTFSLSHFAVGGDVTFGGKEPVVADYEPDSPWEFELYLPTWAAWTEGTFAIGNVSATGNYGFDELMGDLDYLPVLFGGAVYHNRFGYRFDFGHMSLSPENTFPNRRIIESVTLKTKQTRFNQYLTYDFVDTGALTVSLGGGVRYYGSDSTMIVATGVRLGLTRSSMLDLWDGVFAGEIRYNVNDRLYLRVFADAGGGESDWTWQLYAGGGYHLKENLFLTLDYRHLEQTVSGGRTTLDLEYKGPQIALGIKF